MSCAAANLSTTQAANVKPGYSKQWSPQIEESSLCVQRLDSLEGFGLDFEWELKHKTGYVGKLLNSDE